MRWKNQLTKMTAPFVSRQVRAKGELNLSKVDETIFQASGILFAVSTIIKIVNLSFERN